VEGRLTYLRHINCQRDQIKHTALHLDYLILHQKQLRCALEQKLHHREVIL
jgi:hypothetical protein